MSFIKYVNGKGSPRMMAAYLIKLYTAINVRFPTYFAPKEMCRKHYIIEQISGSLHEIQLSIMYT